MSAVERDVKPRNMNFAKVEKRDGGTINREGAFITKNTVFQQNTLKAIVMSTPLGGGYIIFAFFAVRCPLSDVRRPMSGVTHGFRSVKGKVLELLSPNLVCRLIGSVACLGLLLAVVPLLLTE